jgi:hypothetical protein
VAGKGIPRAFEVLGEQVTPALVIERVPGMAMGSWIGAGLPKQAAFLRVALQLAEILARVHTRVDVNLLVLMSCWAMVEAGVHPMRGPARLSRYSSSSAEQPRGAITGLQRAGVSPGNDTS